MSAFIRRAVVALAFSLPGFGPALRAQGTEAPITFDRAGLIPVITRSYADRLGLRPPGWRVGGDYRDVRVLKGDADQYVLVVQRAEGQAERMPLSAEQFESLRLEVETRVSVLADGGAGGAAASAAPAAPASTNPGPTAAPATASGVTGATTSAAVSTAAAAPGAASAGGAAPAGAPAATSGAMAKPAAGDAAYAYRAEEPSKPAGNDFARNQFVLGAALYGPLAAALVEDGPTATAAYIATVAATYFAVVRPAREGKFTTAQNRLATGMAVGGALAGASLAYTLGLGDANKPLVKDKGMLGFALAGALAGAFTGTVLGQPMTDAEAEGLNFGAGAGLLFAGGILAATKGETAKGDARLVGGIALAGLATGAFIGHEYVSRVPYTVTTGDLTGLASPALIGMMAGLTIARPTASSSVTAAAALTTVGMAAGLLAGDWFFVRRWDMTPEQGWMLNLGTIAGAAVMTTPFLLGGQKDAGVLFGAATAGGLLGAWGITQLSNFAPGTMRARPASRAGRVAERGPVQVDLGEALMAASGVPGRHALVSIRF
ncbi:MAG: hypothetical protein HY275_08440 [Gemmatimonadetes bacterium]|nr:hypothetical protein [Gemmatimonadota bacterium]